MSKKSTKDVLTSPFLITVYAICLLYTSDAADE